MICREHDQARDTWREGDGFGHHWMTAEARTAITILAFAVSGVEASCTPYRVGEETGNAMTISMTAIPNRKKKNVFRAVFNKGSLSPTMAVGQFSKSDHCSVSAEDRGFRIFPGCVTLFFL